MSISDINVYPNPTENQIRVSFGTGNVSKLILVDINVKVLQNITIGKLDNYKNLQLMAYPSGVYFVKLIGEGKEESRKVIKR